MGNRDLSRTTGIDVLLLSDGAARARMYRLFARMRARWRVYWESRARRAAVELLHHLDDRALHDIGISRSEIDKMVYGCARNHSPRLSAPAGCGAAVGRR